MNTTTRITIPPVSAIADILALWGGDGWLTPPVKPIVPATAPVLGLVRTIALTAGPTGAGMAPIYDVLSGDLTDHFVVIAGADDVPGAVFGEILASAAVSCGACGVVVDGGVRDRPAMAELAFPVYALGERVVGPNGKAHVSSVGARVSIAGISIDLDDRMVVDETGCVRIAAELVNDVLDAALRYAEAERLVSASIAAGEPLASAYRHKKSIVDELRR